MLSNADLREIQAERVQKMKRHIRECAEWDMPESKRRMWARRMKWQLFFLKRGVFFYAIAGAVAGWLVTSWAMSFFGLGVFS